ncbi:MAG: spore coat protein CotJB [Selenomonadales bacterium]|nr:MAG: spore coat protein CotJB [Selenomonadales bacterium]
MKFIPQKRLWSMEQFFPSSICLLKERGPVLVNLNERQAMLRKVQAASFVLDDLKLYLDTHPTDKKALSAFAKYQDEYERALAEFSAKYGALTADSTKITNRWSWVDKPWPWELEG